MFGAASPLAAQVVGAGRPPTSCRRWQASFASVGLPARARVGLPSNNQCGRACGMVKWGPPMTGLLPRSPSRRWQAVPVPIRAIGACMAFVFLAAGGLLLWQPQIQQIRDTRQRTLWFMAIASDDSTPPCRELSDCPRAVQRANSMHDEYASYVQVAVLSARKHAPNLLPVLLYPGAGPNRLTNWLRAQGGLAFQHRSVLLPRWEAAIESGNVSETIYQAESLYSRYDIPYILPAVMDALRAQRVSTAGINASHVLFTDADVMFTGRFNARDIPVTDVVAIGPEDVPGEPAKNPGVMLINVSGGGTWFPRMLEWADLQWRWRNPYTGHVLRFFDGTDLVTQLPDAYNYKPYWGNAEGKARIVHFHGPKPDRCLPCYLMSGRGHNATIARCECSYYDRLWNQAVDADGGAFYEQLWQQFQRYRQAASLQRASS